MKPHLTLINLYFIKIQTYLIPKRLSLIPVSNYKILFTLVIKAPFTHIQRSLPM